MVARCGGGRGGGSWDGEGREGRMTLARTTKGGEAVVAGARTARARKLWWYARRLVGWKGRGWGCGWHCTAMTLW